MVSDPILLSIGVGRNLSADTSGAADARDRREQLVILVIGGRSRIGSAIEFRCALGKEARALVRGMEPAAASAAAAECSDRRSGSTWPGYRRDDRGGERAPAPEPAPRCRGWHRNAIEAARVGRVGLVVRSSIISAARMSSAEFDSAHSTPLLPASHRQKPAARLPAGDPDDLPGHACNDKAVRPAALQRAKAT